MAQIEGIGNLDMGRIMDGGKGHRNAGNCKYIPTSVLRA